MAKLDMDLNQFKPDTKTHVLKDDGMKKGRGRPQKPGTVPQTTLTVVIPEETKKKMKMALVNEFYGMSQNEFVNQAILEIINKKGN